AVAEALADVRPALAVVRVEVADLAADALIVIDAARQALHALQIAVREPRARGHRAVVDGRAAAGVADLSVAAGLTASAVRRVGLSVDAHAVAQALAGITGVVTVAVARVAVAGIAVAGIAVAGIAIAGLSATGDNAEVG